MAQPEDTPTTLLKSSIDHADPLDPTPTGFTLQFSRAVRTDPSPGALAAGLDGAVEAVDGQGKVWPVAATAYDEATASLSYVFLDKIPDGEYRVVLPANGLVDLAGLPPRAHGLPAGELAEFRVDPRPGRNDPNDLGAPSLHDFSAGLQVNGSNPAGASADYRLVVTVGAQYAFRLQHSGGPVTVERTGPGGTAALDAGPAGGLGAAIDADLAPGVYHFRFRSKSFEPSSYALSIVLPASERERLLANGVGQGPALSLRLIEPSPAGPSTTMSPNPAEGNAPGPLATTPAPTPTPTPPAAPPLPSGPSSAPSAPGQAGVGAVAVSALPFAPAAPAPSPSATRFIVVGLGAAPLGVEPTRAGKAGPGRSGSDAAERSNPAGRFNPTLSLGSAALIGRPGPPDPSARFDELAGAASVEKSAVLGLGGSYFPVSSAGAAPPRAADPAVPAPAVAAEPANLHEGEDDVVETRRPRGDAPAAGEETAALLQAARPSGEPNGLAPSRGADGSDRERERDARGPTLRFIAPVCVVGAVVGLTQLRPRAARWFFSGRKDEGRPAARAHRPFAAGRELGRRSFPRV